MIELIIINSIFISQDNYYISDTISDTVSDAISDTIGDNVLRSNALNENSTESLRYFYRF